MPQLSGPGDGMRDIVSKARELVRHCLNEATERTEESVCAGRRIALELERLINDAKIARFGE